MSVFTSWPYNTGVFTNVHFLSLCDLHYDISFVIQALILISLIEKVMKKQCQ